MQIEREFLELKQGNISVQEFTKKIEKLSLYYSHNDYATNEKWKSNQYKYALQGDIDHTAEQQDFESYDDLVQKAYVIESNIRKMNKYETFPMEKEDNIGSITKY